MSEIQELICTDWIHVGEGEAARRRFRTDGVMGCGRSPDVVRTAPGTETGGPGGPTGERRVETHWVEALRQEQHVRHV
ncbi:hypothetical protein SKAU_G00146870 [Synaphobranchus kaupii]|uniref:Uncharacterized protein n=1 Tax=Synaphobranchus kaupii TaxID=118154 RepID=A0A9Q1J4I8_SYNKA|nr:hypothetical protein SKAU_G00146870 [Synaphobranchus kaupii]